MKQTAQVTLAALCALLLTAGAAAAQTASPNEPTNYNLSRRQADDAQQRPGGHRYDFEYQPFLRENGPYGYYPDFDPRSFSERVFSDPRQSTLGASGL